MFDVGWSELMVIGVVALLVVGPKELPALLRTVGKYMGMVKRQASEFRAQFDDAMRETEFEQLRKDVEAIKSDAESSLRAAEQSVKSEIDEAKTELDAVAASATAKIDDAERKVEEIEHQPAPAALTDARTEVAPHAPGTEEPAPTVNGSASHAYNGTGVDTGAHGEQSSRAGRETQ
jgi:sec-independent protein translocase protein TatB